MRSFYFLQYRGAVFALEPRSLTLLQAVQDGASGARLVKTTLAALGVPPGRKQVRKAAGWTYAPLRVLIEAKIKEPVRAFTTPLTKPLVAFLAQEDWTPQKEQQWQEERKAKMAEKKRKQRLNQTPEQRELIQTRKRKVQDARKALQPQTILDEESE